jgi:hypothetical protein
MSGGKGKSHGGKTGGKGGAARDGRAQMSHSARAGLQVNLPFFKPLCLGCWYWWVSADGSFLLVVFAVS